MERSQGLVSRARGRPGAVEAGGVGMRAAQHRPKSREHSPRRLLKLRPWEPPLCLRCSRFLLSPSAGNGSHFLLSRWPSTQASLGLIDWGAFQSVLSGAQDCSAGRCPPAPLRGSRIPHTLGAPLSTPGRARHNGAFAASPAPSRAPLPAPSSRRGGVLRGNRPAGARAPGLWLLGAGYRAERGPSRDRAGTEQGPSRDRASPTWRAPVGRELCTRACAAVDPARRRPRPGRAARGFHGDGKLASTASATTAKLPAFHPPLGAQRDDRGAGCEERERGDSDPEWHFHGSWQARILPLNHQCFHGSCHKRLHPN
ncbi:uncharacterized protein LOC101686723 [Mustela putorius furo]|uniref:Uncharacterized protein LOC101686723 n=1 Tax=Mustela putorius furo TaxID=9669 RepID=A0A8U0MQA5_MUSPF|nr:uncharacterized protein LOC101686723 [Mustela putorius furo]